jgi:spore coat polysaccharide biosynthesis predicted glycosyltransferase SpsG
MAPDSLDDELAGADLVVTAGGVTMLEALRRGRPTVALVLAENQRDAVEGAAREGALIAATESSVVQEVTALAGDMVRRSALSACAQSYVDGKGAARVAEEIIGRA